ncbi:MAG: T9SS type A sorting domain-containing protein [Flavobacteriales bacterium]|nr:T9SS type A sorting domain-containing protein [Flavobacteriales bacterium]
MVTSPHGRDTDGDLTADCNDGCPNDVNKTSPGTCGCGNPEPGTACNDNNAATINDIIQANCLCAGTLLGNDCNGVPGGPAVPGSACNDNNACTTGDVFDANCLCAGTFADADGDGTCDANDLCTGGPEPGTVCNDNDPCTTGDVIQAGCICAGTFQDADADGTCDANDLCPGGPEPGTSCNDNNACTTGDVIGANCLCAGTVQDTDGDGVCNANDNCPTVVGQIGSACDDGNANTTGDALNTSCQCVGTPIGGCTENLTLSVKLDGNPTQTTWTLLDAATETVTISSGGFTAGQANTTVVVPICVPVGCYHLRVNDSGSNGITNGGYVLRDASSRRIIDASLGSFSSVSQINTGNNPNRSFCVPISNIGMQTATSCDKVRPRTSPIYANTQPGATGYQFWIYDPHGTYNRRVLKTTNQLVPASLLTSPVPSNLDLNVRVRSLTGTVFSEFGPACRIRFTGGVAPAMGEGHSREMEEALSSEVPLTIYPNPNRDGQLTISMEGLEIADGANVDVVIYDLLGKPVVSETAPVAEGMLNHRMDLAGRIGQGLYVVNVTVDGKLYNQRLVMQ